MEKPRFIFVEFAPFVNNDLEKQNANERKEKAQKKKE